MNSDNFYDQLANEDFVVSQNKFQQEMKQIKTGLDKDLNMLSSGNTNLQESSGLVNPLGLQDGSVYQGGPQKHQMPVPNFGRREQLDLMQDDYSTNQMQPSARNPRQSADLTIDMLTGVNRGAARKDDFSSHLHQNQHHLQQQHPMSQNMPRNSNLNNLASAQQSAAQNSAANNGANFIDDGFSIEQFRQNNAQMQEIMMQLQAPQNLYGASNLAQAGPYSQKALSIGRQDSSSQQFKQQTTNTGSNPSTKQAHSLTSHGHEISQFSYAGAGSGSQDAHELPGSSTTVTHKYSYPPSESQIQNLPPNSAAAHGQRVNMISRQEAPSMPNNYANGAHANLDSLAQMKQRERSMSPLESSNNAAAYSHMQSNQAYRQVFKPNSAFQTAAHSIIDSKENLNMNGNNGLQSFAAKHQHQVSHVELLSQLQQQSISGSSGLQQSSAMQTYGRQSNMAQQMNPTVGNHSQQQHQASQPSLAGEFTLQPRQPGQPAYQNKQAPSPNNKQISMQQPEPTQVHEQHKRIMQHFDDIPISQIQKMPGYQTGAEMQNGAASSKNVASLGPDSNPNALAGSLEDEEAQLRPLEERCQHANWKIRIAAYKEINNMFYNDYARFEESKGVMSEEYGPQGNTELMHSFEQYGPLLEKMIKDANSVAAMEGLQVMHTYFKLALEIKAVTFAAHNYLLEKAPTHKANCREVCLKILLVMIERDQAAFLYPELVKRMKSSQVKIASFAMHVINETFKSGSKKLDELNLRNVFKMIQDNLSQKNKELRELAMQILQHVYVRCGDDVSTFVANCKNLRPVQIKEFKDSLGKLDKSQKPNHQVKLFDQACLEDGADLSANARDAKETEAGARHGHASASAFSNSHEAPQRDVNHQPAAVDVEPIDLLTLVPENFQEIPYLAQINTKRRSMEQFNTELLKLRPGKVPIKNRDYTQIYNTVAHMLEDKNMLVFVEAIKTVELLANLIGPLNYLKQVKLKSWVNLLAGKYTETKTAVIAAVDKAMLAIVNCAYNQVQFSMECVNQIASTHKNPRVKQFVIEHTMVPFIQTISKEKDLVGNIFRAIKDKLVHMILKDTSASCRDAAVNFLVILKQIIPENQLVEQAISALPKYRVAEITKRLEETSQEATLADGAQPPLRQAQTMLPKKGSVGSSSLNDGTSATNAETSQVPSSATGAPCDGDDANSKPKFSRSLTDKIKQGKQSSQQQHQQEQSHQAPHDNQNTLQSAQYAFADAMLHSGRYISHETTVALREILYDLGTMHANRFGELYDNQTMEQQWDSQLRQMGEMGIRECKALLINAIFQVVTTPKIQLFENPQYLKSMLNLAKRLYVLERSIVRQDDGQSVELEQYLKLSLLQNVWIANNQGETCQMLQVAMIATNNVFDFTEQLRDVVEQPIIIQCPAALAIIEAVYVWLGIRLNDFLAAGMQVQDLEMLRGFGIKFLDGAGFSEPQRQALISIMIKFKDLVQFKRNEIEQQSQIPTRETDRTAGDGIDKELPSVSKMSRQHTPQISVEQAQIDNDEGLQSSQITHPQTAAFATESQLQESLAASHRDINFDQPAGTHRKESNEDSEELSADNICRLIDTEFEKGLLLFKDMAQQQTLNFEIKEQIFSKLLSIVSEGYKTNPQQQYKQAYALKALMWMKEETLGIEDCFRLTQKVMKVFASSETRELDATVELYLLNFWAKDLSVRDLTDRIGLCVLNADGENGDQAYQTGYSVSLTAQKCSQNQLAFFNSLLNWFSEHRLFKREHAGEGAGDGTAGTDDDEWLVSDLRKIVLYITLSVLDRKVESSDVSRQFLKRCLAKFGHERVKEFMEIQLMHHNELSLQLLDWLDSMNETRVVRKPGVANDDQEESNESRIRLPKVNLNEVRNANQAAQDSITGESTHSHKNSNAAAQSSSSKTTPRGLAGASVSYKERRDLYKMKSSCKVRESSAVANPAEETQPADSLQQMQAAVQQTPNVNYTDMISRIESNLVSAAASHQPPSGQRIDEASGESDEKDHSLHKRPSQKLFEQNEFDGEREEAEQVDNTEGEIERNEEGTEPFRRTNTSAYYRSIERKRKRYTPSAEELADDQDIKGSDDEDDDEALVGDIDVKQAQVDSTRQGAGLQQKPSTAQMNHIETQIELSAMKGKHINDKIQMLELEKMRIEQQSDLLRQQKDEESSEWRSKVKKMEAEHAKVMSNLASVNEQYSAQVSENQALKTQLQMMQTQHSEMMSRFEQIEKKLSQKEAEKALSPQRPLGPNDSIVRESTAKKDMVVSVKKIQRIEDTFGQARMLKDGSQDEIQEMIHRIQQLLLGVEQNVEGELAQPLIIHYTKLKVLEQRMQMLRSLDQALDQNEDVLTALSAPVYKALLNYLLWAFAHEKQILENQSVVSTQGPQADQNQVTMISQQLVSKLLNSKRFTTSLVALFQLLRSAMPNDIAAELSIEERQYLRVIMRCIQRISRALHSEQPDLVRAFDVLVEMQKMFQKHPPELLREDLPCLADFDFVYRGMKDVSDKLIELQPEKVESFLSYASGPTSGNDQQQQVQQNAFIKYLQQMMGSN